MRANREFMTKLPQDHFEELSTLMTEQLRIKGRDFPTKVRRAGRLLPRRIRREAKFLIDAAGLNNNPKLARMVDEARVDKAHLAIKAHLEELNPRERQITQFLNILASVAFVLILTFVIVIYVLVQRGYV